MATTKKSRRVMRKAPVKKSSKKNESKRRARAIGRPTLYSKALQAKAEAYLANHEKHGDPVPTVAGLSVALDVDRKTVQTWDTAGDKPDFSRTLAKLKAIQENKLIGGGLKGDFNAAITKLMLHNHGYHDKVDNKHGGDGQPIDLHWLVTVVHTRAEAEKLIPPDPHPKFI